MKNRARVLKQRHADSNGSFVLYITHHDEGAGDVYRSETHDHEQIAWGTLETVISATTGYLMNRTKHQCSSDCTDWRMANITSQNVNNLIGLFSAMVREAEKIQLKTQAYKDECDTIGQLGQKAWEILDQVQSDSQ